MNNDFYVHFSDHDLLPILRDHPDFKHPCEYYPLEAQEMLQSEYGKIRLKSGQTLRFIFDNGYDSSCPWCGHEKAQVALQGKHGDNPYIPVHYYAECPNCFARGPIVNAQRTASENPEVHKEICGLTLMRWASRRPKKKNILEEREARERTRV